MIPSEQFNSLIPRIQSSINEYLTLTFNKYPHIISSLLPFYSSYNQDNFLLVSLLDRLRYLEDPICCHFVDSTLVKYKLHQDRYKTSIYAKNRIKLSSSKLFSAQRLFSLYYQLSESYNILTTNKPSIVDIASGCGTLGAFFSLLVDANLLYSIDINPFLDLHHPNHP